jgi:alcohol dehydrogenase
MRAVVYDAIGATPELREVPDPQPSPDGVVIAVKATGVCRSDWHAWIGHEDGLVLPHVPGHEFAGEIVAVGAEVTGWRPGERVTVPFVCACGECEPCRAGEAQVCANQYQPGFTGWGSFADLVAVPRADLNLVGLPDELDFVAAAGLGCRFTTAYRAVLAQGRLIADEWLVVFGCGGVGLAAVMIAESVGARVVAVDPSPGARTRAAELGADLVLEPADGIGEQIRAATGSGAHVSLDALGSPGTCADALLSLRPRGRHVQVGLLPTADGRSAVPMSAVIARELEILGSHGMSAAGFTEVMADIAAGRLQPSRLVGPTIRLADAPAALVAAGGAGSPDAGGGAVVVDLTRD